MPTYVYECGKCESTFEVEQRISEDPLKVCECGGPVKRVIQPVGVMFKGSGFYVNDSKPASPSVAECLGEPTSCAACAPPESAAAPAEAPPN